MADTNSNRGRPLPDFKETITPIDYRTVEDFEAIRTVTAITWAVPLDAVQLGIHLTAWAETRSEVNTLRLCHRFEAGKDVFVTRIPEELMDEIEDRLVVQARKEHCHAWSTDYQCFEQRCELVAHFDADAFKRYYDLYTGGRTLRRCTGCPHDGNEVCGQITDEINSEVCSDLDVVESHRTYDASWEERVKSLLPVEQRFFSEIQKMLLANFGLQLFVGHVAVEGSSKYQDYDDFPDMRRTTASFLCTPYEVAKTASAVAFEDRRECLECFAAPSGMVLPTPVRVVEQFKSAMNILGLHPLSAHVDAVEDLRAANRHRVSGSESGSESDNEAERVCRTECGEQTDISVSREEWPKHLILNRVASGAFSGVTMWNEPVL